MSFRELGAMIDEHCPPDSMAVRVIAVDGHGGSGKTTLAERLAMFLGAPIVHTDDFASWEEPINWWPRLLEQVLRPLAARNAVRYQRYDWTLHQLGEWVELAADAYVVLEGVSASRDAFRPYLSFAIWLETPRETCLARGIERDGADMLSQWHQWMADEDRYVELEQPRLRADLVVAGAPALEHDPEREIVVMREGPALGRSSH
jgi:uridine kinase